MQVCELRHRVSKLGHIEVFRQEALLRVHADASLVPGIWDHRVEGGVLVAGDRRHQNNNKVYIGWLLYLYICT